MAGKTADTLQPVPLLSALNRETLRLSAGCSRDYSGNVDPQSLAFELSRLGYGPVRERVARYLIRARQAVEAELRPKGKG